MRKRRAKNSTETPIARYPEERFPIGAPYLQTLKFVSKHRLFRSEPNGHIVFVIGGISAFCPLYDFTTDGGFNLQGS